MPGRLQSNFHGQGTLRRSEPALRAAADRGGTLHAAVLLRFTILFRIASDWPHKCMLSLLEFP